VALETAEHGITANAICPGYVLTPLVEAQIPDQMKANKMDRETVIREVMLEKQPTKEVRRRENGILKQECDRLHYYPPDIGLHHSPHQRTGELLQKMNVRFRHRRAKVGDP
jgi:hypothetical protein